MSQDTALVYPVEHNVSEESTPAARPPKLIRGLLTPQDIAAPHRGYQGPSTLPPPRRTGCNTRPLLPSGAITS